ncbi:unnamed protein product [Durusdinium trenchii]|uniref:Uncharacterized protein n=2 Tax=Durusdinium trenchii TaxID=1381693 RepID=A0ABP0L5Y6_9DINO
MAFSLNVGIVCGVARMAPSPEQVRLPALSTSASATTVQKPGASEGELVRSASQTEVRSSQPGPKPKTGLVTVRFRGDHGISFEGTRVSHSVLQAWMLGVRPGWTALSVDGQAVQTKEDIEDALQAAVEREKRYVVCFEKGQGKFGTEAKEKAERAKRQLAKLRKEFRFQGWIERPEHRGTTFAQIERVYSCLEENCSIWVDHLPAKMSKTSGKPLRMDFLNFYHLSNYLILPVTKPRRCSFVEMMASQPQTPSWFVSHWWGSPVQGFAESVGKHVATRGFTTESSYWIWAFACRLHEKHSEICETPAQALFYKPMETCKFKLLLIIDQQATCFKRAWCLYETAMTVDTNLAMVDVACINGFAAELITHGLTEDEEKMETQRPGHGVRAKLAREANFPMEIAEAGLGVQVEKSEAWSEEDKKLILHSIASYDREEQRKLENAEARLRARLATAFWPRVARPDKDARGPPTKRVAKALSCIQEDARRRSLAMHVQGLSSEYVHMLADSLPPNLIELTLNLRCSAMKDEDVELLAQALPKQLKELKLDLTGCQGLTDAGIQHLANNLNFEETAVYIHLAETGVSKDMQDWYAAEAAKNEENGQNGQLKNVSRALHMSLCLDPVMSEPYRRTMVSAATLLGKVLTDDAEERAKAALRALDSFGEKARMALGADAQQRAKELEAAMQQAEDERKAKEVQKAQKAAQKEEA